MSSSDDSDQPSVHNAPRRRTVNRDYLQTPELPGSKQLRKYLPSDNNSWDVTTTEDESDLDSNSVSGSEQIAQWRRPQRQRIRLKHRRSTSGDENYGEHRRRNKFHYNNYYTHFHRRANYGKFSFTTVLRRWIMATSNFTTKYHREIVVVLCCFASALASLRAGTIKTKTVGRPEPFFTSSDNGNELITDLYRGEYVDLARNQIPYYASFLFYYAHWDSESVEAKKVFVDVAKYFQETKPGQYKFFAINCWWPDGQCRQNYKSLSHFPIFVAHACSTTGVIYNGPISIEPMIRFLESVVKPITRLDTDEELWRFRAQHDAIMLSSMNSSDPDFDMSFSMYRQMALRNLEADPLSQIGFGLLIRRELGEKFYLDTGKTISLVLFNEIHTAKWIPPEKGMKGPVGQVADWVTERLSRSPITWSYPIRNGFATRAVTPGSVDLSEEIGKRPMFLLLTRRYYPSAYSPFYNQLKEVALDYFNCNKSANVTRLRRLTHQINAEWMKRWDSMDELCGGTESTTRCSGKHDQFEHWKERKRRFVRESLRNYENVSRAIQFTGLSCRNSRPFQFLVIDPVHVSHFAQLALGKPSVDPYSTTNRTTFSEHQVPDPVGFIIDGQNELILPFTSFNISEIARVIHNVTMEQELSRKKLVAEPVPQGLPVARGKAGAKLKKPDTILNLTTQELREYLATPGTPLLLMYSAQFCAFCAVTLAQFVRLAEFVKQLNVPLVLGKIDTLKHSLPSTLTPETIPTFVFFPAYNRSQSRVLSTNEPITAHVILKFLLSQLDPEIRVKLSLREPLSEERTLQNRRNTLSQIEKILRALRSDQTFAYYHENEAHTNFKVDLTPEALTAWKLEVLEHLRSTQLKLDTAV